MATITEYFEERGYNIFEHNDYVRRSKLFNLVKTMETDDLFTMCLRLSMIDNIVLEDLLEVENDTLSLQQFKTAYFIIKDAMDHRKKKLEN
jgi:hypothetical protein